MVSATCRLLGRIVIIEGLVTTTNDDGSTNLAPIGPIVDEAMKSLCLRPFTSSRTYHNLKRTRQGVFHIIDDAELLARAAIHRLVLLPRMVPAPCVEGRIVEDACSWYAFRVTSLDDSDERTTIECDVVQRGRGRDFRGWNRARHAVLEAAILATRIHLLPIEDIRIQYAQLKVLVDKTAGEAERRAFRLLQDYVERHASIEAE